MAGRSDVIFALLLGLLSQVTPSVQDCARPTNLQSNVVISPNQTSYGTWSAYTASCDVGYESAGPTVFYCYADSPDYWSPDPSLTVCTEVGSCQRPANLGSNVIITPDKSSYSLYDYVQASCAPGYILVGPTHSYCPEDLNWNPDLSQSRCVFDDTDVTTDTATTARHSQDPELICDSTSMTLIMARSLLDVNDDGSDVHFNDESCVGYTHDAHHVAITTPFDRCSTTQEQTEAYIVYSNLVTYYEPRPEGSGNSQLITREHFLHIPVSCNMKREEVLGESFVPKTGEVVFDEVGYGEFSLSLERYADSSYSTPADDSAEIPLGTPLYFGVNLTTTADISLFLDSCWATQSAYPLGGNNYTMIAEGCPLDDTIVFRNYFGDTFKDFQIDAFAFMGDYSEVFVHCSVLVCDSNDPSSRCARGCVTRARRSNEPHQSAASGSRSKPHTISNGPLSAVGTAASMNRVAGNRKDGDEMTFDPMTVVAVVSLVAFCVLLTATVLIAVRRMRSHSKSPAYQPLASDSDEVESAGNLK